LDCHEGLGSPREHYKVEARALNHAHQLAPCLDLCHWCRTHLPWHFQLLHWLCLAPHGLFGNFLLGLDVWLEEQIASLGPAMVFTYVFINFGSKHHYCMCSALDSKATVPCGEDLSDPSCHTLWELLSHTFSLRKEVPKCQTSGHGSQSFMS
jgi:hypothetical protein